MKIAAKPCAAKRIIQVVFLWVLCLSSFSCRPAGTGESKYSGKPVSRFDKYAGDMRGRKLACFVITSEAGRFCFRFILESLERNYGKQVRFVRMGAYGERNWVKQMGIHKSIAFVLADVGGREVARLDGCHDMDKVAAFFAGHVPGRASLFMPKWRAGKPALRKAAPYLTVCGRIPVYEIDWGMSHYRKLTPAKRAKLLCMVKMLQQGFPGYRSVAWLRDVLDAERCLSCRTNRFRLRPGIADTVVIVPDVATFYAEIGRWTDKMIYPVLIGDNRWSLKFLAAFKPAGIIHRKPVAAGGNARAMILRALWNAGRSGNPACNKVMDVEDINRLHLSRMESRPTGLVVIDPKYSCAPAGVALAAARCQQIWLHKGFGAFDQRLSFEQADAIRREFIDYVSKLHAPFQGYGDDLDGITLACSMPFRYTASQDAAERGVRAVDDLIDTRDNGAPWGVVGRLIGDAPAAVYRAMCALCLWPERALFFSRYSTGSEPWKSYDPQLAVKLFKAKMPIREFHSAEATLVNWRRIHAKGNIANFLFINSSGGSHKWSVAGGHAWASDIVDSVPCQVHMTHSGSASRPLDRTSILGRWLECGAYNYFGSMAEPLLEAFATPDMIARDLFQGYPFAMACRNRLGDYNHPWRLVYFGDPLTPLFAGEEPAKRLPGSMVAEVPAVIAAPGFAPAYHQQWEKVLQELAAHASATGSAKSADNNVWNLELMARARLGGSKDVVNLLRQHPDCELWPVNQLLGADAIMARVKAVAAGSQKSDLLYMAYAVSRNSDIINQLFGQLAKEPGGAWRARFDEFWQQAGDRRRKAAITTAAITAFLAARSPGLAKLQKLVETYAKRIKGNRDCVKQLWARTMECASQDDRVAGELFNLLLKAADKRTRRNLVQQRVAFLIGLRDYAGAEKLIMDQPEKERKKLAYYAMLVKERSSLPADAVKILDAYLATCTDRNLHFALQEEKRLITGKTTRGKHLLLVVRDQTGIKIDGHLGKDEWQGATMIPEKEFGGASSLRLLCTHDKLYLAGVFRFAPGFKPLIRAAKRDGAVWQDESIELLFAYNRDYKSVHQVVFGAGGAIFDYLAYNRNWNGAIQIKTRVLQDRWVFEAALPLKDLFPGGLRTGDVFGFNAVRNHPGGKPARVCWNPCGSRNHNACRYGFVRVGGVMR